MMLLQAIVVSQIVIALHIVDATRKSSHTEHHSLIDQLKLTDPDGSGPGDTPACLYEGRVQSKREWFGYLANITINQSGRIAYEFKYPVERCCVSVLFYLEDQVSLMTSKMNCWQRETLLPPETEQVLRLTPRFPWSGCHVTHPRGLPTYVCIGGRSLSPMMLPLVDRSTTWSIAVSNCASLAGLELTYRIIVHGHVGECKGGVRVVPTAASPTVMHPTPKTGQLAYEHHKLSAGGSSASSTTSCVIEGALSERYNQWYGFFANFSLLGGDSSIRYEFSYPINMQVQTVLLYDVHDLALHAEDLDCLEREQIIRYEDWPDKLIRLRYPPPSSSSASRHHTVAGFASSCVLRNDTSRGLLVSCHGERHFSRPRRFYLAVSNCQGYSGVTLDYRLELMNYDVLTCPSVAARPHVLVPLLNIVIAVALLLPQTLRL